MPLKTIVTILILGFSGLAQAQTGSQNDFVKKFDRFLESNTAKLRWTNPDTIGSYARPVPMPNAMDPTKTHVPDPESGLWHYPNLQKVYDPETGYYISYDANMYYAYKTDTLTTKIYKGRTPVQIKRAEKLKE